MQQGRRIPTLTNFPERFGVVAGVSVEPANPRHQRGSAVQEARIVYLFDFAAAIFFNWHGSSKHHDLTGLKKRIIAHLPALVRVAENQGTLSKTA